MSRRGLILALALLAAGAVATFALTRTTDQADLPTTVDELGDDCTTCDARAADKKRLREYLKQKRASEGE